MTTSPLAVPPDKEDATLAALAMMAAVIRSRGELSADGKSTRIVVDTYEVDSATKVVLDGKLKIYTQMQDGLQRYTIEVHE